MATDLSAQMPLSIANGVFVEGSHRLDKHARVRKDPADYSLASPLLQLENIGNFIRAISKYGVRPHDIFEANDLFENTNYTQVQSTLIALASMVSGLGPQLPTFPGKNASSGDGTAINKSDKSVSQTRPQ